MENVEEKEQDNAAGGSSNSLKDALASSENTAFAKRLVSFFGSLKTQSFLDYDGTVEEIVHMEKDARVDMGNEEDIHAYLKIIDKIQGYRDRATAIYCKAHRDFLYIDKHFDTLQKVCLSKSKAKSLDKREGEVEEVLYSCLDERVKRESLLKHAEQIVWNLNSKFDSVRLKISILHHSIKASGGTDSITKSLNKKDGVDSWDKI
jgi:hypothetical protein